MNSTYIRGSGVLLHPTSLPTPVIGDLSAGRAFVDWLVAAGQRYWQILPLVPVAGGGSPYNGLSALAGNPMLVSPSFLVDKGLLEEGDCALPAERIGRPAGTAHVDFEQAFAWKEDLFTRAHVRFVEGSTTRFGAAYTEYRESVGPWLFDYAFFRALRAHHAAAPWTQWEPAIRDRRPEAMERWSRRLRREIDFYAFQQFLFELEWGELRRYANERGVAIIGDLPIFVAHDSADVWANPDIFMLDERGIPEVVSGVPPDYFSATGQRWGNPLYRWDLLRSRSYDWWVQRFRRTFEMVDIVRVDHFRGFESYWEIPVEEETAVRGEWRKGPGEDFFREIEKQVDYARIIVEDLGIITPAVHALREKIGAPGMRVLQFAFDGDATNPHLPENYPAHSVAYTGTHDNDSLLGWWESLPDEERRRVVDWIGTDAPSNQDFIAAVMRSAADIVIIPLQDLLGLGSKSRMNVPGVASGNWTWQTSELPGSDVARRFHQAARSTGRA